MALYQIYVIYVQDSGGFRGQLPPPLHRSSTGVAPPIGSARFIGAPFSKLPPFRIILDPPLVQELGKGTLMFRKSYLQYKLFKVLLEIPDRSS